MERNIFAQMNLPRLPKDVWWIILQELDFPLLREYWKRGMFIDVLEDGDFWRQNNDKVPQGSVLTKRSYLFPRNMRNGYHPIDSIRMHVSDDPFVMKILYPPNHYHPLLWKKYNCNDNFDSSLYTYCEGMKTTPPEHVFCKNGKKRQWVLCLENYSGVPYEELRKDGIHALKRCNANPIRPFDQMTPW